MVRTRSQAVAAALAVTTYPIGYCARFTREAFGLPATGDRDGDGDVDAIDAWRAATVRHKGDRNPPAGVPVYWGGGSRGFGHAAVSLGGGMIRSTDLPTPGRVGTVPLADVARVWGMPYLGWSEDWAGTRIPLDAPPKRTRPAKVKAAIKAAKAAYADAEGRPVQRRRIREALWSLRKVRKK